MDKEEALATHWAIRVEVGTYTFNYQVVAPHPIPMERAWNLVRHHFQQMEPAGWGIEVRLRFTPLD